MRFVRNLLNERRKRLISSILSHCESEVYSHLPPDKQANLRRKVIGSIGEYHDSVVDIVKASVDDGTVMNEEAMRLLQRVDSHMSAQRAAARPTLSVDSD